METRFHFSITRHNPTEKIHDEEMTFTEARRYMDNHAKKERPITFKVFDYHICR